MRLAKTTQIIAMVNATIGTTTMPQAKKIFRVCALHGFLTQDLVEPFVLSAVLSDCASTSPSQDFSAVSTVATEDIVGGGSTPRPAAAVALVASIADQGRRLTVPTTDSPVRSKEERCRARGEYGTATSRTLTRGPQLIYPDTLLPPNLPR